jgi:DNA recombination protein RmuC
MGIESIGIAVLFILGCVLLFFSIRNEVSRLMKPSTDMTSLIEWIKSTQSSIDKMTQLVSDATRGSTRDMTKVLQENTKQLNERLDIAARVIGDLKKNLGEMSEVGKGIKSLQEFLQSPKLRGNLGEQVLSDMIGQTFPKSSFHLQYSFRSGVKVDAVLKTDAGLLCIDSKFPLQNYMLMYNGQTEEIRKSAKKNFFLDVKKHIKDIADKYIIPEEQTMDFALMYIPSESVYYEIVNMQEAMEFAQELRVYPVSPNTLYAHLQVLLLSFQGKDLEQKSREILTLLKGIRQEYKKLTEQMLVMNRHLTNTFHSFGTFSQGFTQFGQKIEYTHMIHGRSDTE